MSTKGWIGVDLDGTLAYYDGWKGIEHVGEPIPAMVDRVKKWIAEGLEVRIFTARVFDHLDDPDMQRQIREPIERWVIEHIGKQLPITCIKDFGMVCLYDDRCVQVEPNTGRFIGATNTFPDGKIGSDDEGELQIAIGHDDRVTMIKFGKSVDWIGLGKQEAIALAEGIKSHAERMP
jgi:hypothetical protein